MRLYKTGGGLFDQGPGFVFNMGGGPGIRVHQFGGNRPRRRPPGTGANDPNQPPRTALSALQNLLPLLLLFILPILSSLFSGSDSSSSLPHFNIDTPKSPYTQHHVSNALKVPYYVNPRDVTEYSDRKWKRLDSVVEQTLSNHLAEQCNIEYRHQQRLVDQAQGWFFTDTDKMEEARRMDMPNCRRYQSLRAASQAAGLRW